MTSFREYLGKKDTKKKELVTGSFSDFLKSQAPTKTVSQNSVQAGTRPPSKSPANPNTPGHAEYIEVVLNNAT
jgi:hypothetical protein